MRSKPSSGGRGRADKSKSKSRTEKKFKGSRPDFKKTSAPKKPKNLPNLQDDRVRLNKFIATAGVCSRREADKLIEAGVISVNGEVVTEMGHKVNPGDKVMYGDQTLKNEKPVYVLLNKPKNFITTVDDPQNRRTVMNLVSNACKERIYPVGRLDRNTTGLLLFTNDGDLALKLTHPKNMIKKIYHVYLDKNVSKADLDTIAEGFTLDDGFIKADEVSFVGDKKNQIGIEIHSGRNRIVRRIFESFGYKVSKLDRVVLGPLTKIDLPRGVWRHLSKDELKLLKRI